MVSVGIYIYICMYIIYIYIYIIYVYYILFIYIYYIYILYIYTHYIYILYRYTLYIHIIYIYTWNHRCIFTLTTQVVVFLTNMILYGWCDHLLHEAPPQFCFNITPSNNRYIMIYPPEMLVAKCYKLIINQRSHRLGDPFSRWTTELAWRNTVGCRGTW